MSPDAQPSPRPGRRKQDSSGGGKSKRHITRRWTDLAPNEPEAEEAGYWSALAAAIDAGELEEVGP